MIFFSPGDSSADLPCAATAEQVPAVDRGPLPPLHGRGRPVPGLYLQGLSPSCLYIFIMSSC